MSTKPKSPIVTMAVAGIVLCGVYALWIQGQKLPLMLSGLPIEGQTVPKAAENQNANASVEVTKNLPPFLIEATKKQGGVGTLTTAAPVKPLDALFNRQEEVVIKEKQVAKAEIEKKIDVPPPPPPFDYFMNLSRVVKLQAISGDGAVINNKYYEVGQLIDALAYPIAGKSKLVSPLLLKVDNEAIYLEDPITKRHVAIRLI